MQDIINDMVNAQDSDLVIQSLKHELPNHEFSETVIEEKRLDLMDEAVAELRNPLVRDWLLNVGKLLEQTMDMISQDFILSATISKEAEARCKSVATSFEQWIDENKDSQIALQILYDRPKNQMPNYAQIRDLHEKLTNSFSQKFPQIVWQAYSTLSEEGGSQKPIVGGNKLSDLVQLIKHVIDPGQEPLMPYSDIVIDRFHHWMNDQESAGLIFDVEQKRWLEDIANHIAGSLEFTLEDLEYPPFSSNGGLMKFHEVFQGDYTIIETMEGELIK